MFGRDTDPSVGAATQFKTGESGNPLGRPANKPIREAIERGFTPEKADILFEKMYEAATAKFPNVAAAQFIRDSYEGRPKELVEHSGDIGIISRKGRIAKRRAERLDGDK